MTDTHVSDELKALVAEMPGPVISGAALVTDRQGRIVVVNPSYKDGWDLPGGMAEEGEEPHAAAVREVGEEIGLEVRIGRMLVCDAAPSSLYGRVVLDFVFEASAVDEERLRDLRVLDPELVGVTVLPPEQALNALAPAVARRVAAALRARADGVGGVYLAAGVPLGPTTAAP